MNKVQHILTIYLIFFNNNCYSFTFRKHFNDMSKDFTVNYDQVKIHLSEKGCCD